MRNSLSLSPVNAKFPIRFGSITCTQGHLKLGTPGVYKVHELVISQDLFLLNLELMFVQQAEGLRANNPTQSGACSCWLPSVTSKRAAARGARLFENFLQDRWSECIQQSTISITWLVS